MPEKAFLNLDNCVTGIIDRLIEDVKREKGIGRIDPFGKSGLNRYGRTL